MVPQITELAGITGGTARTWAVRCMVPFELSTPSLQLLEVKRSAHGDEEELEFDSADRGSHEDDDEDEDEDEDDMALGGTAKVRGVASSTSTDWYGTRMSLQALRQMEAQFNAGIDYLPAHGNFFAPMEWDSVIGRSVAAEVAKADVRESKATDVEDDYVLTVTTELDLSEPRAERLVQRLESGRQIGQSVGGWFTDLQFTTNEEGEVTDIVVLGVKLDHLAVTRVPANPDATGLELVRWAVADLAKPRATGIDLLAMSRSRSAGARSMVPFQDLPAAAEDTAWGWDTAAQDAVLGDPPDWQRYKRAHTWFDADADQETKGAYKLPIAKIVDGSLKAVWNGCRAAMAVLNGARGGVDIPDDERQGVYAHLKRYYAKWDKEPPELKSSGTASEDDDAVAPARARPDEEPDMPINDADLRRIEEMFGRVVKPVTDRLAVMEQRYTAPPAPSPAPAPAPLDAASADAASLRERLAAAEQRAKQAEQQLAQVMTEPVRVGRHVGAAVSGPVGRVALRDLAVRARADAPSLAAVVEAAERTILDQGTIAERGTITGAELQETLAALCRAAFADGIWKEPEHRAAWS